MLAFGIRYELDRNKNSRLINFSSEFLWLEKTAHISTVHNWFPRETTSENRAQMFYTDDVSLPRSG